MKTIAARVWNEPAVALGLLTSLILAVVALASGTAWDAQTVLGVAGPFASAVGIRQLVTPVVGMASPGPIPQPRGMQTEEAQVQEQTARQRQPPG